MYLYTYASSAFCMCVFALFVFNCCYGETGDTLTLQQLTNPSSVYPRQPPFHLALGKTVRHLVQATARAAAPGTVWPT